MTDPTQNHKFIDKYFGSNISIDLSRSLMIFSFNSLESVNPILRDRMYCVHVKGYDVKDKINIAIRHLIPDILDQHGMGHNDIIFSEEVLRGIINSHLSPQEAGVRGLKRAIGVVVGQINLLRVMGKVDINDNKPYMVNRIEEINDWLKNGLHDVRDLNSLPHMMYV
jgi:ATP-dependent Lon protease